MSQENKEFILINLNKIWALTPSDSKLPHKVEPYTEDELKDLCKHFNITMEGKSKYEIGRDLLEIIVQGFYFDDNWEKKDYNVSGTYKHISLSKFRNIQRFIEKNWIPDECLAIYDKSVESFLIATAGECKDDEIIENGIMRKITHEDLIPMILGSYRDISRKAFVHKLIDKLKIHDELTKEEIKVLFDNSIRIDYAMKQVSLDKLLIFGV